jgi:hypothetical protein
MNDPLVVERDLALDDEAALDRALRIVKLFYVKYGDDPTTAKYAAELAEKLIKVKQNARARHQCAERRRIEQKNEDEILAQFL